MEKDFNKVVPPSDDNNRLFSDHLLERANIILNLPTPNHIKQVLLEDNKDSLLLKETENDPFLGLRKKPRGIPNLTEKDKEDIPFLFTILEDTYLTGSIEKYIELSQIFFDFYSPKEVISVIGIIKTCKLVIWQGQYFCEKAISDSSYLAKLSSTIKTLSDYADDIEENTDLLFYFLYMKVHYHLMRGRYQEVLDGLYYGIDNQLLKGWDEERQLLIIEARITALHGLKKYDEALALIQNTFVSLGNYIIDHPDMMKKLTTWGKRVLCDRDNEFLINKDYKSFIISLVSLVEKYPNDPRVKKLLSNAFSILQIKEVDNIHSLEDFLIAGKLFYANGEHEKAREYFMAAIDISPDNAEVLEYLTRKLPTPKGYNIHR